MLRVMLLRPRLPRLLTAAALAVVCAATACAEVLDATFNPAPSATAWVTVTQPDGKILVGGEFIQIAGAARSYLARLNATGTLDATFTPVVDGVVYAIALQPDGKILIGGRFSTVGGQPRDSLARLNPDGTLDPTFDAAIAGNYVRAILVLPDGRILIGGDLGSVRGQTRVTLARLNAGGSLDPTFVGDATGALSSSAMPGVFSLARDPSGRVLIAGQFTSVNGVTRYGVARVNADGALDLTFNPSTLPVSVATALPLRDGRVIVAGGFTVMAGLVRSGIARVNSDGSADATFAPNADSLVQAVVEQPDGKLLVGGPFTRIAGTARSQLARLNSDGTLDSSFSNAATGSLSGPFGAVYALERTANGRILIAGAFLNVDGQSRTALARLVPPAPDIIAPPTDTRVALGSDVTLTATAAGAAPLAFQWRRNGVAITGATSANLTLRSVQAADAGSYDVVVANSFGSATSAAATVTIGAPSPRLVNVSVRTTLATAQSVIVGLTVSGNTVPILVRAAGPALTNFGLTTALADPRLEVYRDSTKLFENDNWPDALAATFASVAAFPFVSGSKDAALLQPLSGPHSAVVSGTGPGVVLVEAYDASPAPAGGRLVNLSARNRVLPGDGTLIAGFSVTGTGTIRLLIRAVGPTLGQAPFNVGGVLADPKLEIYDANAVKITENDNWDPALASTFAAVGAFSLASGSKDAALVVTVPAGASYTAQVSGVAGTTGEALVEIYEAP